MATDLSTYSSSRTRRTSFSNRAKSADTVDNASSPSFDVLPGPEGTNIIDFGGGVKIVLPESVDFSALEAPFVDFGAALDNALDFGAQNKETFYENINDPRNRDTALGLVDTDIQGIKSAVNQLAPFATEFGDRDTGINISRANRIDAANFARIPGFNRFNEEQIVGINEFNRSERLKSIEASGLDYSGRISKILNQLGTQSEGRLSDPLLDTLMTSTSRNRGADIGAASGITGISGAGVAIQDRLDINQRIQLALDAQKTLPSVLTQAQSVLQPPELQYSGVLASPTGIPLNASNIGDRIPVTSNVSAGQAQLQLGQAATSLETIPASQILASDLNTRQYNATGAFNTQLTQLTAGAAQLQATQSAVQSGFNQVLAGDIRAQQNAAFQEGLSQQQSSANIQAGATLLGGITSALTSTPGGGNSIASGILGGASSILDVATNGIGSVIDAVSTAGGSILGTDSGRLEVGSTVIDGSSFKDFIGGVKDIFTGGGGSSEVSIPSSINGSPVIGGQTLANGQSEYRLENGQTVTQSTSTGLPGVFKQIASGFSNAGIDGQTVAKSANTVVNWDKLTPPQQMAAAGDLGVSVLENKGLITNTQATNISNAQNALTVLANPSSTPSQRATAVLTATAGAVTTPFTGSVGAPLTVQGQQVLASQATANGQPGFLLADGKTVVPQSALVAASNVQSGVQAFAVLTNPNATNEQKLLALTSVGVNAGTANNIISQVAGGNMAAGLAVINTAANWNQMAPVQQATSILQTGNAVMNGLSQVGTGSATLGKTGASLLGSSAPTTGSGLLGGIGPSGIAAGVYTGYEQFKGLKNFFEGDKLSLTEQAALALPTMGFSFLSGPIQKFTQDVFGSGKDKGQKSRDGWRKGLEYVGLAGKENGTHVVNLADGTKYNIGLDGSNKIKNIDGITERNTFDVDWGNQAAVNSIPEAHLFAMASGLDPTSNGGFDLFHRAVSQSLNAASSNATTTEGIRNNFKAMMQKIDPRQLAMRVETLRVTNKIDEQEYGTYLDSINRTFGTEITPADRTKATNYLIETLQGSKKLDKSEKQLLEILTSEKELVKNQKELEERLRKDLDARS